MSRQSYYMIAAKGNGSRNIFGNDREHRDFIALLSELEPRHGVAVIAFCLLPDSYLLLAHAPSGNLPEAMRRLNSAHAFRHNRRRGARGRVFGGPYRSSLLEGPELLLPASVFVHLQPVLRLGLADPGTHLWSSHEDYVNGEPKRPWVGREAVFGLMDTSGDAPGAYERLCREYAERPTFHPGLGRADIVNARHFEPPENNSPGAGTAERRGREAGLSADIFRDLEAFARYWGADAGELLRKRSRSPDRAASLWYLVRVKGRPVKEAADLMGISSPAVSAHLARFRERLKLEEELAARVQALADCDQDR